nr:hypothetical protein [Dyella sp. ASV24]
MAWLDPQWFTFEALKTEWKRKNVRAWLFGLATTAVVVALIWNPETLPTALYIDSVGLEMFLTLMELNILVGVILYRQQFAAFFWALYASNGVSGATLRKAVALPKYSWAAINGAFE